MKMSFHHHHRRTTVPAKTPAPGMTLADVMALPAVTDLVSAGKALGMGRTRSYELARAGQFPCRIIRTGSTYQVPTVSLLMVLGISPPRATAPEDSQPRT